MPLGRVNGRCPCATVVVVVETSSGTLVVVAGSDVFEPSSWKVVDVAGTVVVEVVEDVALLVDVVDDGVLLVDVFGTVLDVVDDGDVLVDVTGTVLEVVVEVS